MKATLQFLISFVCSFVLLTSNATDYIFTGNGDWTIASNWQGGLMPSGPLSSGNTVFVKSNAIINTTCSNCSANTLLNNAGTIIIEVGGTLTLQNLTQLTHIGSIVVNGTMINKTILEIYTGSTITVNGSFINQKQINNYGTITVNTGGKIDNQLTALLSGIATPAGIGTLVINAGGTVVNKNNAVLSPGRLINNGTIDNQSTLSGNVSVTGNLSNSGVLSPGNGTGSVAVNGNYTAGSSSMHNFEVGGKNISNCDQLNVTGTVNLEGVLNVTLANGFTPNDDHDLPVITGNNIKGTFSSVFKPSKYVVVYNTNSVVLRYHVSLPMLYIKLDVKKEGSTARLSWEIHNEPSVVSYEIERSADGIKFDKISTMQAMQVGNYSFTDYQPKDKNFYRIKVIDVGGTYRYSSVISLQQGKTGIALNVFPSPAQQNIIIQHASAVSTSKLLLTSIDGRILKVISPKKGAQQTAVDLSAVNAGTYIMQFENEGEKTETMMFSKQ